LFSKVEKQELLKLMGDDFLKSIHGALAKSKHQWEFVYNLQ